jgi:hypothetical protein
MPVPLQHGRPRGASVTPFPARRNQSREWNLLDLERLARGEDRRTPEPAEDRSYLFLNLRQFAASGGALPREFDGLLRDSFGALLVRIEQT